LTLLELKSRVYDELDEDPDSPSRYPAADVTEYLNDGVAYFTARVGSSVTTATITQNANQDAYDLPSDLVQINQVMRDVASGSQDRHLQPSTPRGMDLEGGKTLRWTEEVGTRALRYIPFGMNSVILYPMISTGTDTFTLTYRSYAGDASMTLDTDTPGMPTEDHDALKHYALARCLVVDGDLEGALREVSEWSNRIISAQRRRSSADRMWVKGRTIR
jgi:hypothetical protein